MARAALNAVFAVAPYEPQDENEVLGTRTFPNAAAAQAFAEDLQAAEQKLYVKHAGLLDGIDTKTEDGQKKAAEIRKENKKSATCIPLDILLQPLNSENEPLGDPGIYKSLK